MRSLALLALVGCGLSTSDAPTTFDPTAVVTGVYHLTSEAQESSCSPGAGLGSGDGAVITSPDGLSVFEIEAGLNVNRYALESNAGYTSQLPLAGQRLDPCGPAGGSSGNSVTTELALVAADAHGFEIDLDRTYVIAAPVCAGVPQASCHASFALHYTLADACPQSCISHGLTPTCSCH